MTATDKAASLVHYLLRYAEGEDKAHMKNAKGCAHIVCDEVIAEFQSELSEKITGHYKIEYWQEVKKQIEFL